jgi:hypothetical protein
VTLAAADISGVSPDSTSNAHHSKTTTASELVDVSADSNADAHHAVFEPADYTPVSDVEGHGNALAIDITGDADTLDGYEGSDLAALSENETVTGSYTFTARELAHGNGSDDDPFNSFYDSTNTRIGFLQFQLNGTSKIIDETNTDFHIDTGGSETIRFTSGNNVGIGTTSPSYALEVNGRAQATTVEATDTLLIPEK